MRGILKKCLKHTCVKKFSNHIHIPFQAKEFMIPSRHCAESPTYVAPFIPETIGTSVLVHMRGEIVIVTVYILK